jgi:hypothetical protein
MVESVLCALPHARVLPYACMQVEAGQQEVVALLMRQLAAQRINYAPLAYAAKKLAELRNLVRRNATACGTFF